MFFAEHVYLVNYKRYLDNFHAHCVNKSLWNEEQCDFFLELTAFITLRYGIWEQIASVVLRRFCFENIFPFLASD